MSFESTRKRRCIVQKLDFENCIVTNIRTTARGKKKLRARIRREYEHLSDIPEPSQPQEESSSSSASTRSLRSPSPVLLKKTGTNAGSPALSKRQKSNPPGKKLETSTELLTIEQESPVPGSPVFKTFKKHKPVNPSQNELREPTNSDVVTIQGDSSSSLPTSFQIDNPTTQESKNTQESKQSVKISSVESPVVKTDTSSVGGDEPNTSCHYNPTPGGFRAFEKHESPKPVKRQYKKKSLLGRLHKLQQKQASEKLLWQHQNRKNSSNSLKVLVLNVWKEEFQYFLKCSTQTPDFKTTFLIIDSRWAPNVKSVREGSVLQVHPPWQIISIEESETTILLNVISLDVLEETEEPPSEEKKTFETIPSTRFEADPNLLMDILFSSCSFGFSI